RASSEGRRSTYSTRGSRAEPRSENMAIIVHFAVEGMNEEKYSEVLRRLEKAGAGSPPGRLHHACYGPKEQLIVVDIYDTPQSFEACGKTLVPILTELGVRATPDVRPVQNLIVGA